jgi:hypothetical protein
MSEEIVSIGDVGREQAPLGPGERVIDGRRFYSAAWLGAAPSEPKPGLEKVTTPAEFIIAWAIERGGDCPERTQRLLEKWATEGPEAPEEADVRFNLQAIQGGWTLELMLSLKRVAELADVTGGWRMSRSPWNFGGGPVM